MDEKLIDTEVLEEGTELVEEIVTDSNLDMKTVGKYGLIAAGVTAAGVGIYKGIKFGKKKFDEFKAKRSEPKKAMSNIQPSEDNSEE